MFLECKPVFFLFSSPIVQQVILNISNTYMSVSVLLTLLTFVSVGESGGGGDRGVLEIRD